MTDNGGWTLDTLRTHFMEILVEKDKAITAAMAAAEKANQKSELLAAKNKEDANEWRDSMNDREVTFSRKEEVNLRFDAVHIRIQRLEDAAVARVGVGAGFKQGWGWAVAVVMFAIALYSVLNK